MDAGVGAWLVGLSAGEVGTGGWGVWRMDAGGRNPSFRNGSNQGGPGENRGRYVSNAFFDERYSSAISDLLSSTK